MKIIKTKRNGKKCVIAILDGMEVDFLNINQTTFFQAKKYMKSLYLRGAYEPWG